MLFDHDLDVVLLIRVDLECDHFKTLEELIEVHFSILELVLLGVVECVLIP
jgi:hypothetical protein